MNAATHNEQEEYLHLYATRLEILQAANLALTASLRLETVLEILLDQLQLLVPYDTANVMLVASNYQITIHSIRNYEHWTDADQFRQITFDARTTPTIQTLIETKKSLLITDTYNYPGWQLRAGSEYIRSWLGVPLVINNEMIGLYSVDKAQARFFTPEHLKVAELLAPQAAIAIQNAQLYQDTQQRLKEMNLLVNASLTVSTALDVQSVVEIIAEKVTLALNANTCTVFIWEREQDAAIILLGYDRDMTGKHDLLGKSYPLVDYPMTRKVLTECQPIIIHKSDPQADPAEVAVLNKWDLSTMMMMPLVARDQVIGLVEVMTADERIFNSNDIDLYQTLANHLAVALENARLFEKIQKQTAELEQRVTERTVELTRANQQLQQEMVEREKVNQVLRKNEEHFRLIFELAPIGMSLIDLDKTVLRVNQAFCNIVGYQAEELIGRSLLDIAHREDVAAYVALDRQLIQEKISHFQLETRYIHRQGYPVYVILQVALMRDEKQQPLHLIGQVIDITERKRVEAQLLHNALHDPLTDLPNRALFLHHLERSIERAKQQSNYKFAVLFLDLDRFKTINDTLGPKIGDEALVTIAQRLKAHVRSDDVVAHLGGDEFAVLLDSITSENNVEYLSHQIQHNVSQPFYLNGQKIVITASIGVTFSSRGYTNPEDFLRDADTAMYQAKNKGGAMHTLFDTNMHTRILIRLRMEIELRQALERRELEVYYQPIVSLTTGKITKLEALLRWPHAQRGFISPAEFIPVAEETGLIIPIGIWLLQTACTQTKIWHELGYPDLQITVNVSVREFQYQNLFLILSTIRETGLSPQAIELEITETIAMHSEELYIKPLHKLKQLGVQLSIDDFGTGYSSLSRLKSLPVSTVKIDRSFIADIPSDTESTIIVSAMIAMAHTLNLKVVAEGVETIEQLDFLRSQKCDEIQGYIFSPPLPVKKLTALLQENRLLMPEAT